MKILVISLAGIGDTLFATPLIHELRANFPAATIDALVFWPGSRDVLRDNPYVNTIYQKNLLREPKLASLRFLLGLRRNRYDLSLNTHPQSRTHYRVAAWLAGARLRLSHQYDRFSWLDSFLVNRTVPQDYTVHAIENNRRLLEQAGGKRLLAHCRYELFLSEADRRWAADLVAAPELSGRRRLAVHVGSGGTKNLVLRRWPLEHYVAMFQRLGAAHADLAILLLGGPEEARDHERILAQTDPHLVFHPRTSSLRQAAALLEQCHAFLSVDTALMHVAAAVGVPSQIVIETPTWNNPIKPHGNPYVLVQNPGVAGRNLDFYRYDGRGIRGSPEELLACMRSVTVDDVSRVVEQVLAAAGTCPKREHSASV